MEREGLVPKEIPVQKEVPAPLDFYFDAGIDDTSARTFINFLRLAERKGKDTEIVLHINSNGGSVQAVMDMIKQMRHIDNPIATIAESRAMSAAALLLSAGTPGKRKAYEDCDIMVHQISSEAPTGRVRVEEIRDFTKDLKHTNKEYFKLMSALTNKSYHDILKETHKKDLHLTAKQAKEWGIIDEIIPVKKRELLPRKDRNPEIVVVESLKAEPRRLATVTPLFTRYFKRIK